MIHLTNDAIQKLGDEYGKYEGNNKINFSEFQKYLDGHYRHKYNIKKVFNSKMKTIAKNLIKSVVNKLDPLNR